MAIDVGVGCNNLSHSVSNGFTRVAVNNPANATGTIDSVCVWANSNMTGIEYASFIDEGGNVLSTNGDTNGSNLAAAAGQQTTHTAPGDFSAFAISSGEHIGIWWTGGALDRDITASSPAWLDGGDQVPCISSQFTYEENRELALYAVGAEVAGVTITLTKVAMILTGKDISANAVNLLSKVAVVTTGKSLGGNMSLVLPKDSLSLTGKDMLLKKINILTKVALSLTGKDVIINKVNSLAKVAMSFVGKSVTPLTTGLITLVKIAMTMTGKALAANKINALTKVAIVATGKSLFANMVGVLTKVAITLTGKNVALNKLNNLAKGTLTLTGKAVTVLGGVVGRATRRFFDFF